MTGRGNGLTLVSCRVANNKVCPPAQAITWFSGPAATPAATRPRWRVAQGTHRCGPELSDLPDRHPPTERGKSRQEDTE